MDYVGICLWYVYHKRLLPVYDVGFKHVATLVKLKRINGIREDRKLK